MNEKQFRTSMQTIKNYIDSMNTAGGSDFSGDYNDLTNKPTIPDAYTLPTASATVLGGVKVGSGLKITDGVLSTTSSGGGGGTADFGDWSITPDENGNLNFTYNG